MAGATALTGTVPDSAPHSPLKTSLLSPVARMRFMAASGVPTMLTPRTSSSGRPSTYTRYTTSGMTWKACGELRVVTAKPEEMSSK